MQKGLNTFANWADYSKKNMPLIQNAAVTITTTDSIEGATIESYHGVLSAEVVHGVNVFRDGISSATDVLGGRNRTMERAFAEARETALGEVIAKARSLSAHAVINVRFNYQTLGKENGMVMVAVSGTAVRVQESESQRVKRMDQEKNAARDFELARTAAEIVYHVEAGGKVRGPFSIQQVHEMLSMGKISDETLVTVEGRPSTTVAEVLRTRYHPDPEATQRAVSARSSAMHGVEIK